MSANLLRGLPIVVAAVLVASVEQSAAQSGSITGVVRSAENQAPVVAAVVQAISSGGDGVASTLTNQSGRYVLSSLPVGTYSIAVSMTGYQMARLEGVTVGEGVPTAADLTLIPRAIDLDPVVISASRRQERALEAPARTEVVTEQQIEVRPTVALVDHLRNVPGVDIATHGLQSANIVTRGFNNIFSGSLFMLSDHRLAGVPSLRVNLVHLVPTTDEDVERMEVVLGPGSALYGPNTANGVLHILTKSPLTHRSTSVSIAGGDRSVFMGTFRTAHLLSSNLGVKVSGQYMRGEEWPHSDPVEQQARAAAIAQGQTDTRVGLRDYEYNRWSGEARADWRITPEATGIISVGRSTLINSIELTGIGAVQAQNWSYTYYQARFNRNRFFAQAYLNASDAGETYTLRDDLPLSDRSKLFVSQVQHGFSTWANRQTFTYGLDYFLTMPKTEGTIHGRYEEDDEFSDFGGFVQSETSLTPRFDLVLAGRLDTHSELQGTVFSPRAALVFKPSSNHTIRGAFNRAYSNPRSLDMFLDISGGPFPDPDLAALGYGVRAMGPGREGFHFRVGDELAGMRSPFTPAALGGPAQLLPANTATMWALAVGVLQARGAITSDQATFLNSQPPTGTQVGIMGMDVLQHKQSVPIAQVAIDDIGPLGETHTTSFEVGYKGLLGERLLLAADAWWARRNNFISALRPITPLLFLNGQQIAAFLVQRGLSEADAAGIAGGMAMIPLGVVSSEAVSAQAADFLLTYRNFGEVDLWGADVSAQVLITPTWSATAMASIVHRDHFRSEGELITMNAPRTKLGGSIAYRSEQNGFNGEVRFRYNSSFPVLSAPFVATACLGETGRLVEECVNSFTLVDLLLGHQFRRTP